MMNFSSCSASVCISHEELSVMLSIAEAWAARTCNCLQQETQGHNDLLPKAAGCSIRGPL